MKKSKPPYKHVWSDGDTGHYYLVPLDASESLWQIHRKNRGRIALISEPGTLAQTTEIVQLLLNPNSAPYPAPSPIPLSSRSAARGPTTFPS